MSLAIWVIILFIFLEVFSIIYYRLYQEFLVLRILLFIGVFIHEASHALACFVTGASVYEFNVGLYHGHVKHGEPKIPILGNVIISLAPFFVGICLLVLLFMWVLDVSSLNEFAKLFKPDVFANFSNLVEGVKNIINQIDFMHWKFWAALLLMFNILATFHPSPQDFKNITLGVVIYVALSLFPFMRVVNISLIYVLLLADGLVLCASLVLWILGLLVNRIYKFAG